MVKYMLTKDDLLTMDTRPHINDVSLQLYKDFCNDVLFKRRFHYYFTDGTDIIVECREWGVYHMLSIQHIDYNIQKDQFFNYIDSGLSFKDFTINNAIKSRFRTQKERITMFSCVYCTLRYGRIFYIPNRIVENTTKVKADYLIYRQIDTKGMNLGIRYEDGCFVPLTILISKPIYLEKYINNSNQKIVSKLLITEKETEKIIENIIYTDEFILHTN